MSARLEFEYAQLDFLAILPKTAKKNSHLPPSQGRAAGGIGLGPGPHSADETACRHPWKSFALTKVTLGWAWGGTHASGPIRSRHAAAAVVR